METKEIKEVKILKSGEKNGRKWTAYQVVFEDGQKASTFDHKIAAMAGKTISVELQQDGQYVNIGKWEEVIDAPPENPMAKISPPGPVFQPSREASIEAQVAVKEIGEAMRCKIEIPDELTAFYWGWIRHALAGILPEPVKRIPETPKPAPTAKKTASKQEVKDTDPDDLPF
jgi:hypothetical protein